MNLNEECLLQFLQNDRLMPTPGQDLSDFSGSSTGAPGVLNDELRRILRHRNIVSFPTGILIRRPWHEL